MMSNFSLLRLAALTLTLKAVGDPPNHAFPLSGAAFMLIVLNAAAPAANNSRRVICFVSIRQISYPALIRVLPHFSAVYFSVMSFSYRHAFAPVIILCAISASLEASSFDAVYAFGDSLSDAGNIYAISGGTIPGAPYSNGRFTNGNVWVQDLSQSLGLGTLTPSRAGGTDYAYGDAYSGSSPIHPTGLLPIDLPNQISQFQAAHSTADPSALYTIWIGSNDLSSILQSANPTDYAADSAAVIMNINSAINSLAGEGAKNFLVLTVPDLGKTPAALASGSAGAAAASALSYQFDLSLASDLSTMSAGDSLNLNVLDTYSLIDGLVANPSAYGFTNVTAPCVTGAVAYIGGTACAPTVAAQNQYLFWDSLHPTSAAHQLVADAALADLPATATPEPTTLTLLGAGLIAIALKSRRRS